MSYGFCFNSFFIRENLQPQLTENLSHFLPSYLHFGSAEPSVLHAFPSKDTSYVGISLNTLAIWQNSWPLECAWNFQVPGCSFCPPGLSVWVYYMQESNPPENCHHTILCRNQEVSVSLFFLQPLSHVFYPFHGKWCAYLHVKSSCRRECKHIHLSSLIFTRVFAAAK